MCRDLLPRVSLSEQIRTGLRELHVGHGINALTMAMPMTVAVFGLNLCSSVRFRTDAVQSRMLFAFQHVQLLIDRPAGGRAFRCLPAASRRRAFPCGFQERLIATVEPWMVLIPPPVSSVGSVSAVLSRSLILRGYHAVGITAPVNVDVIAMAAPPTTNLVHQIVGVSCGSSGAKVSSEGCSSDCDYHLEASIPCRLTNVLQLLKFQTAGLYVPRCYGV